MASVIWFLFGENADPTSGMAGGTVICSDGRLASYAAIAIGCQEYYTSPFDSASTEGGLISTQS